MTESFSYINAQTTKVAPFPLDSGMNGQIRLKLQSEKGASNWMNISPEQMRKIEKILAGIE